MEGLTFDQRSCFSCQILHRIRSITGLLTESATCESTEFGVKNNLLHTTQQQGDTQGQEAKKIVPSKSLAIFQK